MDAPKIPTVEETLRAQGVDPANVKFGRLVGPDTSDPFSMPFPEFQKAAVGGRALDAADVWFAGFAKQHERMTVAPSEESLRDLMTQMADVEISLVCLMRLRRAAVLLRDHAPDCQDLENAVRHFNEALPDRKHLRDTQEHFDDYVLGRGQRRPKAGAARQHTYPEGHVIVPYG